MRDVVQEVAVVGDRDDGARVLLEEPLEPFDRLGVEMVRGLVEQEQVGVPKEQPAERHATLLAAREDGHVGVVRRAAQRIHGDLDVAVQVPGIGRGDVVLERRLFDADRLVVGVRLGPLGHDGVVAIDQALDLVNAVHDVAPDILGGIELRFLAQEPDREPRRETGLAGEAVVQAGHDPQQAGLPRPVRPDDADLGARIERDRDVLEHGPIRRIVPGELVRGVDEFGRHAIQGTRHLQG